MVSKALEKSREIPIIWEYVYGMRDFINKIQ